MIDFSTLQGLEIPEGVVTEIADASGRVLWVLANDNFDGTFKVEKITATTYSGETERTETFILFDVYPKQNGTVNITYGGLTKTITDTSGAAVIPNARQVFFGTFYGVSDSVETPASGIVTITGDVYAVGCGTYKSADSKGNETTAYANCVTAIGDLSGVVKLPNYAFYRCRKIKSVIIPDGVTDIGIADLSGSSGSVFRDCTNLTSVTIPNSVTSIYSDSFNGCSKLENINIPNSVKTILSGVFGGCSSLKSVIIPDSVTQIYYNAFSNCTSLTGVTIPSSVTAIDAGAFINCTGLTNITIPDSVKSIGSGGISTNMVFSGCTNLAQVEFSNTSGWYVTQTKDGDVSTGTIVDVSDPANNATLLKETYVDYYWYRS